MKVKPVAVVAILFVMSTTSARQETNQGAPDVCSPPVMPRVIRMRRDPFTVGGRAKISIRLMSKTPLRLRWMNENLADRHKQTRYIKDDLAHKATYSNIGILYTARLKIKPVSGDEGFYGLEVALLSHCSQLVIELFFPPGTSEFSTSYLKLPRVVSIPRRSYQSYKQKNVDSDTIMLNITISQPNRFAPKVYRTETWQKVMESHSHRVIFSAPNSGSFHYIPFSGSATFYASSTRTFNPKSAEEGVYMSEITLVYTTGIDIYLKSFAEIFRPAMVPPSIGATECGIPTHVGQSMKDDTIIRLRKDSEMCVRCVASGHPLPSIFAGRFVMEGAMIPTLQGVALDSPEVFGITYIQEAIPLRRLRNRDARKLDWYMCKARNRFGVASIVFQVKYI